MSTPNATTVNTTATTAQTAIMTAVDNAWIAAADIAVADAASRGLFMVRLSIDVDNLNLQAIVAYYEGLGYIVSAPLPPNVGQQPSNLFGSFWQEFWQNPTFFFTLNGIFIPKEIYLSWAA